MGQWPIQMRVAIGALFVATMGVFAVRSAFVKAYVDENVTLAHSVWAEHPDVLASVSMIEVGQAAGQSRAVPLETMGRLRKLAAVSPLAAEPFLVSAATMIRNGNYVAAERLLIHARTREPRSEAARYLLGDLHLRQNRLGPALENLSVLRRLVPSMSQALAPALADYVRRTGAGEELRAVLKGDPELENLLLTELAADHRNAGLVLQLARPHRNSDTVPAWHQRLVASLVKAGEYDQAHDLWRRYAAPGDAARDLSTFRRSSAPSPFTWTFAETSAGSATPENNVLQIFFTGRENVSFASKVVMLAPGIYRLSTAVTGRPPAEGQVSWSVTCLPEGTELAQLPLSAPGNSSLSFAIPQSCRAQKLELKGMGQTFPEPAEFTITNFSVRRVSR